MKKKIGFLFSLSGTISIVGEGQLQASLLAVEEINKNTNLKFEPVIRDAKSNPLIAAQEAYGLFRDSKIDALVGCYMSSVRNSVLPVLNETGGLLIYPTLYEGEQINPNIFYIGAVPNQQVEPLLSWTINNLSSNFVLVGSDYVYPRSTNKQVKEWVQNAGGRISLERYFPLGRRKFGDFFDKLKNIWKSTSSIVVFSTLVGTSVISFYNEYRRNNLPFKIISPITSEREIQNIRKEASSGHICTSAYFQTIDTKMNKKFVNAFKQRFGDQPISREMAASYEAVKMLSMAYDRISSVPFGRDETEKVRMVLKRLSFEGIQGKVMMDPNTQHLWQWSRIGRINPDGKIKAFWTSAGPVRPKHQTCPTALNVSEQFDQQDMQSFHSLIGKNTNFLECLRVAKVASMASSNILITGETGTGKELLAWAIHNASSRSMYSFVPINCATIPHELISSELFGYEEGSFTGARKGGMVGKFGIANGGTLFLDEIGEMPQHLQACLLRVVEEKEIYRVGATKPMPLDVRLIASTNKDLLREMSLKGSFRKDLFYRLSVFHIDLPKLCERPDDISLLADHFLQRLNSKSATAKIFAPEALEMLQNYDWPGNVRELANVVERSFYISLKSKIIRPIDLPDPVAGYQSLKVQRNNYLHTPMDLRQSIYSGYGENMNFMLKLAGNQYLVQNHKPHGRSLSIKENEELIIRQTLTRNGYNISRSAFLLGISRTTLYRKIKRYKIDTKMVF